MALPFVKIKFVLNEKERNSRILLDATIEKNDKNEIPCHLISECCLEFIKHKNRAIMFEKSHPYIYSYIITRGIERK